jgi:hypothetical protein
MVYFVQGSPNPRYGPANLRTPSLHARTVWPRSTVLISRLKNTVG